MFEKLKQFKDLRSKAKTMQNTLAEEKVEVENRGIKIIMDGNQKILSIKIDTNLTAVEIEKIFPDLFNEAIKKVQKIMVEKMQGMGGLGNLGL